MKSATFRRLPVALEPTGFQPVVIQIIKCVDRSAQGYKTMEKNIVETRYIDDTYRVMIQKMANKAKVETYFTKEQSKEITK